MAVLGAGRANDATLVSSVDDVIQELELDLCQILGIEPGQPVNASIFGDGLGQGGDGYPIQADGSIRSILKLTLGAQTTSPNTSAGFEFDDGNERYRIVIVASELRVYHYTGGSWVLVNTLNAPIDRLVDLSDVDMPTLDGTVDGYRVVVDTVTLAPDHFFKLVAPEAGEAVRILTAEDISPPSNAEVGNHLTLFGSEALGFFVGYDPPGAGAPIPFPIATLTDAAPTITNPLVAANDGGIFMQGFGANSALVSLELPLLGAGGGVFNVQGSAPGTDVWRNVTFENQYRQDGNGWRSDEFFSDLSQIITIPEPGFYFIKYITQWPNNNAGSRRSMRLVLQSGNAQLGNTHRFSPSFLLQDGEIHVSNSFPLIAFDFIRCDAGATLRYQVAHDAGDGVELSCTASIGLVKIR